MIKLSFNSAKTAVLWTGILLLIISLFAVALFGGMLLYLFGFRGMTPETALVSRLLFWLCLWGIYLYAMKIERQPLLLWEENTMKAPAYLLSMLAIFGVLFVGLGFIGVTLKKLGLNNESLKFEQMLGLFRHNQWLIIFTALTAGVVEELTFRGYLLPRLTVVFKSPVLAIFVSSLLFGFLHFGYGTVAQIIGPFFIGLVFAFYYYEFRNIKVLIICHFLWDLMAIYLRLYMKH